VTINHLSIATQVMTLNVNSQPFHQSYACFDQTAEAGIKDFQCKVALYLSCLRIEFDDEVKRNLFDIQHTFLHPKLN